MRTLPVTMAMSLLLLSTIVIPKPKMFVGEIMDSQCARAGTHGVLKPLNTPRQCTLDCVKLGGKYVLYDPALRLAYGLDDQQTPEAFAGGRVQVIGTLDHTTYTIHVIEMRSATD
jgi:hypothetical protein